MSAQKELTHEERIAAMYASFTDEELEGRIRHEKELKDCGYDPDELDLKKRGYNPVTCDEIIAEVTEELARRRKL